MGTEARNEFSSSTPSMIKFVAVINHYGNIIKNIYKRNATSVRPECGADEDWEDVILCENKIVSNGKRY